ncbi:hypothetical protein ACH495_12000 [Micromonospora sp. NPDC018662]|uniref:hypothetical protein n=1 Tax=Micromonospora sp. NPDC018662 TaxID=3364238 RepID=UPI0037B884F8
MTVQWTGRPESADHDVVETDDPEHAHHLIARRYGDHRARIPGETLRASGVAAPAEPAR